MKAIKGIALTSSLFKLEIAHIKVIDSILASKSLESATEYWASRCQLKFVYVKTQRLLDSPFDVTLGCIRLAYGLEYQGSFEY